MADLKEFISEFGASAKGKLANAAVTGAPEDQLRAPLETLILQLAELAGHRKNTVKLVGETTLAHLASRPDYAVSVRNALCGFIEVKAPGKGFDPRRFTDEHDKKQWQKLKTLPNLIYTDGNGFTLWQDGELKASVALEGDIEKSGSKLTAPPTLLGLLTDFLAWEPIAPRTAKQLAGIAARLCRLLREEVAEELEQGNPGLTSLAKDWRNLLFPEATNKQFADGYAQAITFGLLVARVRKIDLADGLDHAAVELRKTSGLIGTALRLLVDDENVKTALKSALDTLRRVLNEVDWNLVSKGDADAWLYFYEDFLEVYDNDLRKQTGSYYTPPQVVDAMVRLVDEALRDKSLFKKKQGLADTSVTICDPAVGTGTYLLGVLRQIARSVEADKGAGAVAAEVEKAASRMFAFEMQFGPFAVAQLRLIAEMQALVGTLIPPIPNLYITDTLGDPYAAETQFSSMVEPIAASRKEANRIKREQPITVVIGNPPYKNKAADMGGWIEDGSDGRPAPMDCWTPPPAWGIGAHTHHLKNLYVYFWRWATLKVFGSGHREAVGGNKDGAGIVCFITVSGFLNGPGFQKMREDLRRDCSAIWVIDCSPEGHQPEVNTRLFQGVQQPVCIVLAARTPGKDRDKPAVVKFLALPEGHRERVKFEALEKLSLKSSQWSDGSGEWREPFLPSHDHLWGACIAVQDAFEWSSPGVMTHRTWVIAPDEPSLRMRWRHLQAEPLRSRKDELFHPDRDRTLDRSFDEGLGEHENRSVSVQADTSDIVAATRFAARSLDRRWIIPDKRLISQPRPPLWREFGDQQVYLTAPEDRGPKSGPSLTVAGVVPDVHHYNNRGGRVYPLWRDAEASVSNIKPSLLAHLTLAYGRTITPEDMMAYVASVMAHPAFTARFKADLVRPGLRLPITADADLFERAAALGREVIWLHTYGERMVDEDAGRPQGPPRMAKDGPTIPRPGAIPSTPEDFPNALRYDSAARRLLVGTGYVDNVSQAMVDYDVSGMNVLNQWFSYRKKDRRRPIIGDRRPPSPLSDIQPDHWLAEYTSDLLDLLHVLGRLVAIEPAQADVLEDIVTGTLIEHEQLIAAGALGTTGSVQEVEEN
ncbi:MAG: DNA methyltransferase [Hyphomicrobium sp. 32-62-53]|nr:MAG: DNA methyltransferase [Hyphomicrobium sp. 12-62-95]OYX98531.1 MAG: DNA methyltransferase [Hyphomicrobium sp. 32-62-53]